MIAKPFKLIAFCLLFFSAGIFSQSQAQQKNTWITSVDTAAMYKVTKFDGNYFVGKIITLDEREILMLLPVRGRLVIPAYEVRSIEMIDANKVTPDGHYLDDHFELAQYFLNTSAHGIEKGRVQVGSSLFGPDLTVGLTDKLSVRLMTTWVAAPIMSTLNYRIPLHEKFNMQFGLMGTWSSWFDGESGMVLPFAAATIGGKQNNLTFTGGYGFMNFYGVVGPAPYAAASGKVALGTRWGLLFDSYFCQYQDRQSNWWGQNRSSTIVTRTSASFGFGTRYTSKKGTSIQLGVAIISDYGNLYPFPLIQVFHKFN